MLWEFYNLELDPGESTDVAGNNPSVINEVEEIVKNSISNQASGTGGLKTWTGINSNLFIPGLRWFINFAT